MILESDGVVFDVAAAWYAAHVAATQAVGWSWLDQARFWRLIRTKGREADVLPAAKPVKLSQYWGKFDTLLETDAIIASVAPHDGIADTLLALARSDQSPVCFHGESRDAGYRDRGSASGANLVLATVGGNLPARRGLLECHGLARFFPQVEYIDVDPRRRPAELRILAADDPRAIVVAASDALIRSAGGAELFSVGVSSGACNGARLHQAGASLVYKDLSELAESLASGGHDLVRAGLLPRSLD